MLYTIAEVEKIYPNWYDENSDFSRDDQQWIWENLAFIQPEKENKTKETDKTNVNGSVSVNGGHKIKANNEKISSVIQAISELRQCKSKTAPKIVANHLQVIFQKSGSKDAHWIYISQVYTPKTINSVLNQLIKKHERGELSILNPAAYFTSVIQRRHKRKINNGNKKQISTPGRSS